MSWFPQPGRLYLGDLPATIDPDEPAGAEVAPGVTLARRHLLVAAGALLGGTAAGRELAPMPRPATPPVPGPLTFDQFLAEARPLAVTLTAADQPNEAAYLHHLAGLLGRLDPHPRPHYAWPGKVTTDTAFHHLPLVVLHFKLAPGAVIPLHDHADYNGLVLGVGGTARVRNFDPAGPDPLPTKQGATFRLRQTSDATLTAGRASLLTRKRDNFHLVTAGPAGAEFLDVFTYFRPTARSYFADLRDKPLAGTTDEFEASWKEEVK